MLGLFGPKSDKIAVYKAAFAYQGAFRKDFSTGSPVINEVVLGCSFLSCSTNISLSLSRSRRARASRLRCLCAPCLSLRASSSRPQFLASCLLCTFSLPPCCVYSALCLRHRTSVRMPYPLL